jgi:hypothetical protein|tara:strand:- start:2467 stop:3459 length:993 start_codon:yes stop_codon:yes gene_type:complete
MNKNYIVLYCNKNQYEMFEQFAFKYSPVDYAEVDILIYDDNSIPEQKSKLRELCDKYDNITWINPNVSANVNAPNLNSVKFCDEYLIEHNIDVDWILFFENDCFPFQKDFWDKLNEKILKYKWLVERVGSFGFSNYQKYDLGITRKDGSPTLGRGNLIKGILEMGPFGWYKYLSEDYYTSEYFVIESVNWQSICVNRKLYRKFIEIDERYDHRLLNFDDMAHQFLSNNIFNICFPDLSAYHDPDNLKRKIKLISDSNYSRSNSVHEVFQDRWGFKWGARNTNLRSQFNSAINDSWWDENNKYKLLYENSIQKKLFEMHINDGPKRIEDFE